MYSVYSSVEFQADAGLERETDDRRKEHWDRLEHAWNRRANMVASKDQRYRQMSSYFTSESCVFDCSIPLFGMNEGVKSSLEAEGVKYHRPTNY